LGREFRSFPGFRDVHSHDVFRRGRQQEAALMLYGTLSRLTDQIYPPVENADSSDPRGRQSRFLINIWHAALSAARRLQRELPKP
jgi:hypothetical protein